MTALSSVSNIQALDISQEEQHFLRIANLLHTVATTCVRVKFDKEFHPSKLKSVLDKNKAKTLIPLQRKKIINQDHWNLLFPISGTPTSKTFDLTLMLCLIRNLTDIEIRDSLPFCENKTDGADLTRIKYYRNKVMHSIDGLLSETIFKIWWNEISQAILRLGGTNFTYQCNTMRTRNLDSHDREILTEFRKIIGKLDQGPKGLQELRDITILEWEKEKVAETRAIRRLNEMIVSYDVAVAIGPSGCGKSTAIHYIALQLALKQNYQIIIAYNLDEIRQQYDSRYRQVFVIDDVLGVATFDEEKAKIWIEKSNDMRRILQGKKVKLLVSCKTHIFEHQIVKNIELLYKFSCDFLSRDNCLTDEERENIANLYLTTDEIVSLRYSNAFSEFDFFPVLCRYYSKRKSDNIVDFFLNPIKAIMDELYLLWIAFDRTTFATLFLFVVYNNSITESLLSDKLKTQRILEEISEKFVIRQKFSLQVVKIEVEKLMHSFLKKHNDVYAIIHDKIFDVLVHFCGIHQFDYLLDVAHTDIVRDRFVFKTVHKKNRKHDHLVEIQHEKENNYFERLQKDIINGFTQNVFSNQNLTNETFRLRFITEIVKNLDDSLHDKTLFRLVMSMIDRGFCDIVAILITKKMNLNRIDWDGETPLFKAVCKRYTNVVELLLKKEADPNLCVCLNSLDQLEDTYPDVASDRIGDKCVYLQRYSPPLVPTRPTMNGICAVSLSRESRISGSNSTIRRSVESFEADVKTSLKCFSTSSLKYNKSYTISPLHIAASKGYTEIVKLLLSYHAEFDYVTESSLTASPLLIASNHGYKDIVQLLLDSTSVPDIKEWQKYIKLIDLKATTLKRSLCVAVEKGYYDIVMLLLGHKYDLLQYATNKFQKLSCISVDKKFYRNLVWLAISKGHDKIVKLILEKDDDSDFINENDNLPLLKAINDNKLAIVKLLLELNLDPTNCIHNDCPLYMATLHGRIEIVKLLLKYKCDPYRCLRNNKSCLFIASDEGHSDILKLFLDHKSDRHLCNKDNESHLYKSAFFVSLMRGNAGIVKLFLDHNYDINVCNENKESPLFVATWNGNIEIIKLLLQNNGDPNICNENNESPLFVASSKGYSEIVHLLLDHNSDPKECNKDNESPLYVASYMGHTEIVRSLLDHYNDPDVCTDNNQSPLFAASKFGRTDIVKILLDRESYSNICTNKNESPLFQASRRGHKDIVKLLLEHESDPNLCNKNNYSPLYAASHGGHLEIVKLLLYYYSDPNVCTEDNESPLFVASYKGYTEIVKLLLSHKSNPNICNKDDESPLFPALKNSCSEIVKVLLDNGSTPCVLNKDHESPLFVASCLGHSEMVKLLLDHDSDPNICNKNQESPLFVASLLGHSEMIQLLLDHDSDPNICNKDEVSPLFVASLLGHSEMVKLFLDHDSNPNKCNKDQESPLFVASLLGHSEMVKLLLDHDSDPNICNKDQESPLFVASRLGHSEMVKLFLDHDSDPNICNKDHESCLFVASCLGYTEIVKVLLDNKSDPNLLNNDHKSPLFVASCLGYFKIVKLLLDHDCNHNVCKNENRIPLFMATAQGHTAIVKLFIDHNSNVNVCFKNNVSLLHLATFYSQFEIVKLMLDYYCECNVCNDSNESPLFIASTKGYINIVTLLLERKSDPNICNENNESPLFVASSKGHAEIVKLLLKNNSDTKICNTKNELTLITQQKICCMSLNENVSETDNDCDQGVCIKGNGSAMFARSTDEKKEKLLVNQNSDPNLCNKNNQSPLFSASNEGHTEIVELLLDHHSDPNICTNGNESPLFVASFKGYTEIVKLLLDHECNPNLFTRQNESPLFVACGKGHTDIVKLLLNHECNPDVCTKRNESPLLAACGKGYTEIVKLLLAHNSNPYLRTKENKSPLLAAIESGHTNIAKLIRQNYKEHNLHSPKCSKLPFVRSQITSCTNKHTNVHKSVSLPRSRIPQYMFKHPTLQKANCTNTHTTANVSVTRKRSRIPHYMYKHPTF